MSRRFVAGLALVQNGAIVTLGTENMFAGNFLVSKRHQFPF